MHDVRHDGNFVARFETEELAHAHAALHGFDVEPGRSFELHCEDGFIDSFSSEAEATAAMEVHGKRFKSLVVKSSDGEALAELEVNEESAASELPTDPAPPEPTVNA